MKAKVLTGLIFCLCLGTLFLSTLPSVAPCTTPSFFYFAESGGKKSLTFFISPRARKETDLLFLARQERGKKLTCFFFTNLLI
jgi:hypothetical protein